jgi:hypothetical protein
MFTDEAIAAVLGAAALGSDRRRSLDRLATSTVQGHWHVSSLGWDELPLFPMPDNARGRRLRAYVELGKRAIKSQLAAEEVAVTMSRYLLLRAEADCMHRSVRRALAAVLNDEASHLLVMIEMDARAEAQFPEFPFYETKSPLLSFGMETVTSMHPGLAAMFMGTYEAMIAIRSYAEQASYGHPSILGQMAGHAAEDDGRHAKVMRLVSHEWLDALRRQNDGAGAEERMREAIVGPIRRIWPIVMQHEHWLLNGAGGADTLIRIANEDASLANHLATLLGLTADERAYANLEGIGLAEARAIIGEAAAR